MVNKQNLEALIELVERADGHADRREMAEARDLLLQVRIPAIVSAEIAAS
jgi:hypothetical protein